MYSYFIFQISFISVPCLSAGEASEHPALISEPQTCTLVPSSTKCFAAALSSNSAPSRAYGCFVSDESYLANYGILTFEQKY